MNRLQFWVLTWSIILVGPLFLIDIYLSHLLHQDHRQAVILENLSQEGSVYANRWQQLAARIYQLSPQDPPLREILVREHINVTPKSSASTAPASAPPPSPAQSPGTSYPAQSSP